MAKPKPPLVSAFNPCGGRAHPGGNDAGEKPWGVSGSLGECLQVLLPNSGQLQSPQDSPPADGQQWVSPRYSQERGDADSTAGQDAPTSSIAPPAALLIDRRSISHLNAFIYRAGEPWQTLADF